MARRISYRQVNALFREASDRAVATARRHTVPLARRSDRGHTENVATGLLLRVDGRPYLVSAGHAFDELGGGVFLPIPGLSRPLSNRPVTTPIPAGLTRDEDSFDVGYLRLTAAEEAAIGGARFFVPSDRAFESAGSTASVVYGFPAQIPGAGAGTPLLGPGRRIDLQLCRPDEWARVGVIPAEHLLLERAAPRRPHTARRLTGPIIGMSGSGVWSFPVRGRRGPPLPSRLEGIFIELPIAVPGTMLATRIGLLLQLIRGHESAHATAA